MQVSKHVPAMIPLIAVLSISTAQAQTTIDTTSSANSSSGSGPLVYVEGQTFTAPTDSVLNDFTFLLQSAYPSYPFQTSPFRFEIAPFIQTGFGRTPLEIFGTTGPSIFTSGPYSNLPYGQPGVPNFTSVTFNVGGLALTPGAQYAAIINIQPYATDTTILPFIQAVAADPPSDAYSGGFLFIGSNKNSIESVGGANNFDTAFIAHFSPSPAVPETSTTVSLGLLLALGAGVVAFRRKGRA